MANEKILNTRIQLKYDSYAKWAENNPTLKAGEIAIAYLAQSHTTPELNNNTHPVMFKVGPGAFNSLPWASALAADVHAWAKLSESEFVNGFLSLKNSDGTTIQAKLDAIFATGDELTNAIAALRTELTGNDGIAGLAARVKVLEDDRVTEQELADAVSGEVTNRNQAIADAIASEVENRNKAISAESALRVAAEAELQRQINAIDFVDENELATELAPYAKSADVAATYETIANANLIRGRLDELEAHDEDYKAYADEAEKDAIAAAKIETENQVKALSDSIKNHDSVDSFADVMTEMAKYQIAGDYATKAEAQGYANAKDEAIQAAKNAADEANRKIDVFMSDDATVEGAIDTLKEINKYITDDTNAFVALSERVEDLEDGSVAAKEAEHADVASELDEAGIEQVKGIKVNNAVNADVAAKASGLDASGEVAVKAVKVDNAGHADNADQLGGVVAANYALKTDAQGYADTAETNAKNYAAGLASNYATAAQGAKADSAVQPGVLTETLNNYYTKSQADAAFMDSTETDGAIDAKIAALKLAENYEPIGAETRAKAYADGLAGNYATAAQGAKADSAVQEVTGGEGLKATRTGNNITIGFDPDVVFVFNCGSSTELVD